MLHSIHPSEPLLQRLDFGPDGEEQDIAVDDIVQETLLLIAEALALAERRGLCLGTSMNREFAMFHVFAHVQ